MPENLITVFVIADFFDSALTTYKNLISCNISNNVYLVISEPFNDVPEQLKIIRTNSLRSSKIFKELIERCKSDYLLLILGQEEVRINENFEKEFLKSAEDKNAGIVYSAYYEIEANKKNAHPLINYQPGSIRDDFDFGKVLLLRKEAVKKFLNQKEHYNYAGLYSLRLSISEDHSLIRIPKFLYTVIKKIERQSVEKQFEYVDPQNRKVQIEMEKAATNHLKQMGAYLKPIGKNVELKDNKFIYEASVIIPVKNRSETIMDAVASALKQQTKFAFNIIIIDNHSTDGTTELLKAATRNESRILHIIPQQADLEIGGCWNIAISDSYCGRFAIQLDSDDIYKNESTLQKTVDKFYEEDCAMVIGSYELTDFKLKVIPPGIIDHREWSNENGHNNALRINGFGAPRAFYTPIIRKIKFPNVSYGEDYAVALAISREYKIGRIYESIYLCRRWKGNTDSGLTLEKENVNNFYKDQLRTIEIIERQKINNIKKINVDK